MFFCENENINFLQEYEEIGGLMFDKDPSDTKEKKPLTVEQNRIVDGRVVTYYLTFI